MNRDDALQSAMYAVTTTEGAVLLVALPPVILVAAVPAVRAARVDPAVALCEP